MFKEALLKDNKFGLNDKKSKNSVPLQQIQMNCSIQDSFITLQICQSYINTFSNPLEVEYVFPVPNDASVASLKVQTETEIIDAVIEEKDSAIEKYEDIMSQGNTGFIASYDKDESQDRMVLYIGNLQSNQQVTVIITYIGICAVEQQSQVLLIPCAFMPKYDLQQTASTQVQMTDKVTYKIDINCDISYQQKQILSVECLHHQIITQQESPFHWKINLNPSNTYVPNQDFILKFQTEDQFVARYLLQKNQDIQILK